MPGPSGTMWEMRAASGGAQAAVAWLIAALTLTAAFAAGLTVMTLSDTTATRAGLALLVAAAAWALSLRHAVARLSLSRLTWGLTALLPGLAIVGPVLALPAVPSASAFRLALALLALLLVVQAALAGASPPSVGPRGLWTLLVLWYAWLAITMIWAPDQPAALNALALTSTMLALAACVSAAGCHHRTYGKMLTILAAVFALTLVVGVGEAITGRHLPISAAQAAERADAVATAWFVNSNDLATYLAICWPFVLLGALQARRARWRAVAAAGLLVALTLVVLSGSRTSLIAIVIATVACAVLAPRVASRRTARRLWTAIAALLAVFAIVLVVANVSDLSVLRQFRLVGVVEDVQTGTGSGGARLDVAKAGLGAVSRSYFLGIGAGNAESVMRQSGDGDLEVVNLHSWWLDLLVNSGVPGLLLFLSAYGGLLIGCARIACRRHPWPVGIMAAATAAALLGFLVGAFGPSTSNGFAPLWTLLGVGMATVLLAGRRPGDAAAPQRPADGRP